MSDSNDTGAAANGSNPAFTERELQMLGWAMQSLKTGPPEIDYEKLAGFAGMSNPRSASNAWAKIKGKLITNPDGSAPSPAPKKAAGSRKKAAPAATVEDGEPMTPKKSQRKRAAKKQEVDGEDESPKKKGRAVKKAEKSEETVKEEPDESEELETNGTAPGKAETEVVEESIEVEV